MTKKKKVAVLIAMVAILVVAAYLNIALLNKNDTTPTAAETMSFFASYRMERQQVRAEEISQLDAIIALEGSEYAESKQEAAAQKLKLIQNMETELLLENLIKAKGYSDVVVRIGTTSENINVAVKAEELTKADAAKIYDIIRSETNKSPECVKIVPVK